MCGRGLNQSKRQKFTRTTTKLSYSLKREIEVLLSILKSSIFPQLRASNYIKKTPWLLFAVLFPVIEVRNPQENFATRHLITQQTNVHTITHGIRLIRAEKFVQCLCCNTNICVGNTVCLNKTIAYLGNTNFRLGETYICFCNRNVFLGNTNVCPGNNDVCLGNTSVCLGQSSFHFGVVEPKPK